MDRVKRRRRQFRTSVAAGSCLLFGGSYAGLVGMAGPASATPLPPACGAPVVVGTTATVTCNYTGADQSFTFPAGVTQASFDVLGAQGADNPGYGSGGLGGEAIATLTGLPGTSLVIVVGQAGSAGYDVPAAFGGGGVGGEANGGGGSFVQDLAGNDLLVAGGGGGAGQCLYGSTPSNGGAGGGVAGDPGTICYSAYGTGGAGGSGLGSGIGQGGSDVLGTSGGGGGGYVGGSVSDSYGGGGGGSGFGPPDVLFHSGVQSGNGEVIITYHVDHDLSLVDTPGAITVDATSPAGAQVSYKLPTAGDEDNPATATVGCDPQPGSTFAIGTTTVTCSATDGDDSNSPVTATFDVTVKGAAAQLQDLYRAVIGVGPGHVLADRVAAAARFLADGHGNITQLYLQVFQSEVNAFTPRYISPQEAGALDAAAQQIIAVIG